MATVSDDRRTGCVIAGDRIEPRAAGPHGRLSLPFSPLQLQVEPLGVDAAGA